MIIEHVPKNGNRPNPTFVGWKRAESRHMDALLRWKRASKTQRKKPAVHFWVKTWGRLVKRRASMALMK